MYTVEFVIVKSILSPNLIGTILWISNCSKGEAMIDVSCSILCIRCLSWALLFKLFSLSQKLFRQAIELIRLLFCLSQKLILIGLLMSLSQKLICLSEELFRLPSLLSLLSSIRYTLFYAKRKIGIYR